MSCYRDTPLQGSIRLRRLTTCSNIMTKPLHQLLTEPLVSLLMFGNPLFHLETLPVFTILNKRGITVSSRCLLCDDNDETKSMEGAALFTGGVSKGRQNPYLVLLDAVGEAILKAKELGYYKVIILNHNKRFVQICNGARKPTWQELTLITDLNHLHQQGPLTFCFWVPKLVLSCVLELAFITTCFLVHLCRTIPNPL